MHFSGNADRDGLIETTADGVVSLSCGCSDVPPPLITPPPIRGSPNSSCSEGGAFSIESETLPDAQGCFLNTAETRHDLPVYTISGTLNMGQFWVVAIEFIENGMSAVRAGMHMGRMVRRECHKLVLALAAGMAPRHTTNRISLLWR